MRGTFRFYQEGQLVGESSNLITTAGKLAIQRYLAGYSGHFGRSIRLGIGATAAAVTDVSMNFEVAYAPVYLATPDYANTAILFKGRLDDPLGAVFYEAGLSSFIPDVNNFAFSKPLVMFDSTLETFTNSAWNTSGVRFGAENLRVTATASTTTTSIMSNLLLDFSAYSSLDDFTLAYNPTTAFTSSVILRFYTDSSNYYSSTISTPASGFKVQRFSKGSFTATGSPSWSNITQIGLLVAATAGGTATVDFEGIRAEDNDTFIDTDILVSRTVLGAPVTKVAGMPMDIEYTLDLTL